MDSAIPVLPKAAPETAEALSSVPVPAPSPAQSIPEVLSAMAHIAAVLPDTDGIACFNHLYRQVTQAVQDALQAGGFADPGFLIRLDVLFANLYFTALSTFAQQPQNCPRAWDALFNARQRTVIGPLRFALAGMNAHINRDLAVALTQAWTELGAMPDKASAQYADFSHVNQLLARLEGALKDSFLTATQRSLDPALHGTDDALANWSIAEQRAAAWDNAEVLWSLRHAPALSAAYVTTLDRMVGLASSGLLAVRLPLGP